MVGWWICPGIWWGLFCFTSTCDAQLVYEYFRRGPLVDWRIKQWTWCISSNCWVKIGSGFERLLRDSVTWHQNTSNDSLPVWHQHRNHFPLGCEAAFFPFDMLVVLQSAGGVSWEEVVSPLGNISNVWVVVYLFLRVPASLSVVSTPGPAVLKKLAPVSTSSVLGILWPSCNAPQAFDAFAFWDL